MGITVVGHGFSPFVRKVRAFLAEKGIDYAHEPLIPANAPPAFSRESPLRRIPVLRDGDLVLPDSSVICAYLERRHPQPVMYPPDPVDHARALWIEEYVDGGMVPVVGPGIFRPRVLAPLLGREPDEAAVQRVIDEELPPFFDYLDGQVRGGDFFVGYQPSIADVTVASVFVNLHHARVVIDASRWPALASFVERMHGRPSFKSLIDEEASQIGAR